MKTLVKLTAFLVFFGAVTTSFGQQKSNAPTKQENKKQKSKKNKVIDNKIAVSDQAQPNDKSKGSKKQSGISNK